MLFLRTKKKEGRSVDLFEQGKISEAKRAKNVRVGASKKKRGECYERKSVPAAGRGKKRLGRAMKRGPERGAASIAV